MGHHNSIQISRSSVRKPIFLIITLVLLGAIFYRSFPTPEATQPSAYVTYLSYSNTTTASRHNEAYFQSVRVLLYQLLHSKVKTDMPVHVLCTESLPEEQREMLRRDGARVDVIETHATTTAELPPIEERWRETLTKLHLFRMTQYEKVCYLDASTLIHENLDEVFSDPATTIRTVNQSLEEHRVGAVPLLESYSLAAHAGKANDEPAHDYFSAGFMVVSPSKQLFDHYLALSRIQHTFQAGRTVQDLLNFAHERRTSGMPWQAFQNQWNANNHPTEEDFRAGVKSFHDRFWQDDDHGVDQFLRGLWLQQKAMMEAFYQGKNSI